MSDSVVNCPGCSRPLHVPASAAGRSTHCPHCRAVLAITWSETGTPTSVKVVPPRPVIAKSLMLPGLALVLLGLAGVFVNGYLSLLFFNQPGADLEFARGRVKEVRSAEALSGAMHRTSDWVGGGPAALCGAAPIIAAEEARDEALAESWVQGLKPIHLVSTVVSLLAVLGGIALVRGRLYPLALLGCAAALVNVNHLCCIPGGIAGVWGFMLLVRDDARDYFRRP